MASLFRYRYFMALWIGQIVSATGDYFFWLALPRLVKEENLLAANGLMQTTMTIALIAGPGLAGIAIQYFGTSIAFVIDSVSTTVVFGAIVSGVCCSDGAGLAPGGVYATGTNLPGMRAKPAAARPGPTRVA